VGLGVGCGNGWLDDEHGVWILWNGVRAWRRVGECVGDVVLRKGGREVKAFDG